MIEHRRGRVPFIRSSRARPRIWIIALATTFLTLGACAVATQAKHNAQLRRELDGARINQPLTEAWPVVLRLLADHGYQLVGHDRVVVGVPTETLFQQVTGSGSETEKTDHGLVLETMADDSHVRHRAEGIDLDGKTCQVRFTSIHFVETYEERSRDPDLELELVQRLDPEQAERITHAAGPAK